MCLLYMDVSALHGCVCSTWMCLLYMDVSALHGCVYSTSIVLSHIYSRRSRYGSSPASTSSLSEPSCLVAECVTEGGAVDDSADILAACDGTTPPEGLRASTSGLDSGVVTKMSFDLTRYIVYRYIWSTPHLQCTPHVWSTALLCCTCVYGCSIIFM